MTTPLHTPPAIAAAPTPSIENLKLDMALAKVHATSTDLSFAIRAVDREQLRNHPEKRNGFLTHLARLHFDIGAILNASR